MVVNQNTLMRVNKFKHKRLHNWDGSVDVVNEEVKNGFCGFILKNW